MHCQQTSLHLIVKSLVIIGGLNWGLIGLLELNLVEALFGTWPGLVKVIYLLVGIAALVMLGKGCHRCKGCKKH
jgi:uncharacterized membrane protein YuzA (DUF378 family)